MLTSLLFKFASSQGLQKNKPHSLDRLDPLRQWLNSIDVQSPAQAHTICRLIPAQCPFERDIQIGRFIRFSVPPLCKLNPLYEEVVSLRFRALCYLAEECSDDVCRYC
ncbi:MAG: Mo-dependent nitrogenase C-terminal domain-containing protein [Cyanobacteria bacterium P01_A01_bin.135]